VHSRQKKRQHILSDAELRAVWLATANPLDPFATLVRLLILTGQRRGEVAGIRRTELRLDGAEPLWTIPTSRTKNGTREGAQPHAVPLAPHVVALLVAAPEFAGCDYILSRDGEVPISGFSKSKRTLDKAIGEVVREWRLHDLRRTAASGMQRLGVAVPVIERALNHTSGTFRGIVGTYQVDLLARDVRAALTAWAAHIGALVTA
jgi:integrase